MDRVYFYLLAPDMPSWSKVHLAALKITVEPRAMQVSLQGRDMVSNMIGCRTLAPREEEAGADKHGRLSSVGSKRRGGRSR